MMSVSARTITLTTSRARRTSTELTSIDRVRMRKERLNQIEKEQRREDRLALKMTEEQREILFHSFISVKTEFSDLDGLSWTKSALLGLQAANNRPSSAREWAPLGSEYHDIGVTVLTDADLASFDPDDTIRVSRARHMLRSPIEQVFVTSP